LIHDPVEGLVRITLVLDAEIQVTCNVVHSLAVGDLLVVIRKYSEETLQLIRIDAL